VLRALASSGGMLGFSLYPHHLKDKSACRLDSFCDMIARTADLMGIDQIGLGSDLCQDQPDSIVEWMRVGRWTKDIDYGEGSASDAGFPPMPDWFQDNRHFGAIATGLRARGFSAEDTAKVMGENWLRFYDESFGPQGH
ncbi:MAG: membrane dipeptidase, partial [Candidatus Puniceispirillum sp.]